MANPKIHARLVEKAALGLVTWNLARRGIECLQTSQNSHAGDIWARLPEGSMVAIEVKGSTGHVWNIRDGQSRAADWFVFVSVHDAACWVLNRETLLAIYGSFHRRDAGVATIARRQLPADALGAWSGLSASKPEAPARYQKTKIVRRKLADGTIKEYQYGPKPRKVENEPTYR